MWGEWAGMKREFTTTGPREVEEHEQGHRKEEVRPKRVSGPKDHCEMDTLEVGGSNSILP